MHGPRPRGRARTRAGRARRLLTALLSAAIVAGALGTGAGTAMPASAAAPASLIQTLGDFENSAEGWVFYNGSEFPPGAGGAFTLDATAAVTGASSGKLTADFADGGQYVAVSRSFTAINATSLGLWVQAPGVSFVNVRLTDTTGQIHQQTLRLSGAVGWQQLAITDLAGGVNPIHWGGANDGLWHGPATAIQLVLDKSAITGGATKATLNVDDITAAYPAPDVQLTPIRIGNVFTTDQPVQVRLTSGADSVSWTVTDAGGNPVASGSEQVTAVVSTLTIAVKQRGWFSLHVDAQRGGTTVASADTTLARLASLPDAARTASDFVSVQTHFAFGGSWSTDLLPLVQNVGAADIRDEAYWSSIEPTKGSYVWPSQFDYLNRLAPDNISPMVIVDYGNPNYDSGTCTPKSGHNCPPVTDAGRAAFAGYADAVLDHYPDVKAIEVWNEWNIDSVATPEAYEALLATVYAKVKADHPDVTVVGGGLAFAPLPWIEAFCQAGGLDHLDALSIHPYNWPAAPEAKATDYDGVTALLAKYSGDRTVPLWVSEDGWPTGSTASAVDERTQAAYLVRAALVAKAHGVSRFSVYDLMDDGTDPANPEHNFGLLHNGADPSGAYTPKPSYVAYATLARQLAGTSFVASQTLAGDVNDEAFRRGDSGTHALWTTGGTAPVTLHTRQPVTITDLYGQTTTLTPDPAGTVSLQLTGDPVFASGAITRVEAGAAVTLTASRAFTGEDVPLTWGIDNSNGKHVLKAELRIAGVRAHATVPAGARAQVPVAVPGTGTIGTRTLVGEVVVHDRSIARLAVNDSVVDPLRLQATHVLTTNGQALRVSITNLSPIARQTGGLTWRIGTSSGTDGAVDVPAGGHSDVDVPLTGLTAPGSYPWKVTVTADAHAAMTATGTVKMVPDASLKPVAQKTVAVGGDLPDMTGVTGVDLATDGTVQMTGFGGTADLSGNVWFTYDPQNLYLTARIHDDVYAQPASGGDIWQGDSVQFSVGAGTPGEQSTWSELGTALTPSGPEVWRWLSPPGQSTGQLGDAQVHIVRDETAGDTVYEVALPWSDLSIDPTGRLVSVSMLVNDNDGAGRKGWIEWGGGIGGAKDSSLFNAAVLNPAP